MSSGVVTPVAEWFGGLGAAAGLCALSGWTLSATTTFSERQIFKGKKVVGEYPKFQKHAPAGPRLEGEDLYLPLPTNRLVYRPAYLLVVILYW
jgi:hypothetical protein